MGISRSIAFVGTVVTLLLATPVAGASAPEHLNVPAHGHAARLLLAAGSARCGFTPLAARLLADTAAATTGARSGSATLAGSVSTSRGPVAGAKVSWSVPGGAGKTTTDTSGLYSFSGLPAATGNGSLVLEMNTERLPLTVATRFDVTWPAAASTTFDFPFVNVRSEISSGGPWTSPRSATAWLTGRDALSDVFIGTTIASGESGSAPALPGVYDSQQVYWYANQGQEYHERLLVSPTRATICAFDFLDADIGWMLAAPVDQGAGRLAQSVFATHDGGATWKQHVLDTGNAQASALDFADASHGWAVGYGYIWHTNDGGATWARQLATTSGRLSAVQALDQTHACAVGERGLIVTTSDGSTWSQRTSPLSGDLKDVCFTDANHGLAAGAGGILATADGGETWTLQSALSDATVYRLDTHDGQHVVATGMESSPASPYQHAPAAWWSDDGAASWKRSASALTGSSADLDMADASTGWLVTSEDVFKTSDGGKTWTRSLPISGWAVAALSTTHALAGGSSGALRDTLDGQTWSAESIKADQASALRVTVRSPLGASGKPGSQAKVTLSGLPAGYESSLTGRSDYPDKPARVIRNHTSKGGADETITMTVPGNATPGYLYWFGMKNRNGALWLEAPFQVSTLKASRSNVMAGSKVTFSGIVPTKGHVGRKPGVKKRLHLWMSTESPTKGYKRIDVAMCKGNGSFAFESVRPKRTAWWIVVYNGDSWYWTDATSPVKVTVR